ncbi:MAG: ATP-grasp domain-containing protein [Bacteroidetes bacterium]|nr:MAG: ATP-grasp domain-containing protein [Bacteroidota bacterium]
MDYTTQGAVSPGAKARFEALQRDLVLQFRDQFPDPLAPKTVVIVPSNTLDPEILGKIEGVNHYEERMLALLLLLRMPRTHVIFVSSIPINDVIIDYYLHLLPGITTSHARARLTLLSCYDASPRALIEKVLARPRLIEKIKSHIPPHHVAHMAGFNITYLEHELALQLGVPLYGCSAELAHLGSKSGGREVFRRAGLMVPPGFEHLKNMYEVRLALAELKREHPELRKAVVKLNDGFSGEGNAVINLDAAVDLHHDDMLRQHLRMVAKDMTYDVFSEKMELMGGVVEGFVDGAVKSSPSVQVRINPLKQIEVVSTHDQVLGGESGQVYLGATFPADPGYVHEVGKMGYQVAEVLSKEGVIGRFGVDFISVKEPQGWWKHYAIEINLRKGGTTHPFLMLKFLTNGYYDHHTGNYYMPNGQTRYYFSTDCLQSNAYKGLTPEDLIDITICNNIQYDDTTQEGVMFHLMGALSEHGKLGMVCIGSSPERAKEYYRKTVEVLDRETGGSEKDRMDGHC